jgi:predicted GNAT family acetyltransferase
MPSFEIITLSPTDWQRYRALRLEALQTEPRAFLTTYVSARRRPPETWQERLAEAQAGQSSWLFFAQAGDRLVGLAGAFAVEELDSAEIVQVYVSPDWRKKGVAAALIEATLAALAGKGILRALLTVNVEQRAAVALYQKLGFEIIGQSTEAMADGQTYPVYHMEKRLSA